MRAARRPMRLVFRLNIAETWSPKIVHDENIAKDSMSGFCGHVETWTDGPGGSYDYRTRDRDRSRLPGKWRMCGPWELARSKTNREGHLPRFRLS